MVLELFLLVFTVSLICAIIARKIIRHDADKEIKNLRTENERLRIGRGESQQPTVTEEGWANNDIEGAVYDSDGKRIR